MAERIELTIDIGPKAPIEIVRQVVDSIDVVCQFADELTFASEARPVREVTGVKRVAVPPVGKRTTTTHRSGVYEREQTAARSVRKATAKRAAKKATTKAAAKKSAAKKGAAKKARIEAPREPRGFGFRADDGDDDFGPLEVTTVESIQYQNPFTIVLAGGALIYLTWATLVSFPRFLRDYRAKQKANDILVSDLEDTVSTRKILRLYVLRQVEEGKLQLTPDQINSLLTPDVAAAYKFLGDQNIDLKQLPPAPAKKPPEVPAKK